MERGAAGGRSVTPGASEAWHASSSVASRADPLFSGDGYLLLDTHRVGADDLRMDNAAALLAGLENPSLERIAAQLAALRRRLDARELKPLRELMLLWAQRVSRRRLNLDLGIEDMAELDRLHESGDLEVFFTERALAEREKLRSEGRGLAVADRDPGVSPKRETDHRVRASPPSGTCCAGRRRASSMRARRSGWRACWRGSTIPSVSPRRETGSSSAPAATS